MASAPFLYSATSRPLRSTQLQSAWVEVWSLAWPAMAHMLLVTLVFVVDRLLVGQHSAEALSSLQLSSTLVWTVYTVGTASTVGTLSVVARYVGACRWSHARRATVASLGFSSLVGLALALTLALSADGLANVLFPSAAVGVRSAATTYLEIVALGLPFAFFEAAAAAALQGSGDTRSPLAAAVVANFINLLVSATLIFGLFGLPSLGVGGAAVGTASAMVAQAVLMLRPLQRFLGSESTVWEATRLDALSWAASARFMSSLRRVLRVSGPVYAERAAHQAGYVAFVAMIALLGTQAMALNQALSSIEAVCFLTADGLGIAAGALVGQRLGAGDPVRARALGRTAALVGVLCLSAMGLVFACLPETLLGAFVSEPEAVGQGVSALYVAAFSQPFVALATVSGMALRGAGATRSVLVITLIGALGVRLSMSWLLAVELEWGLLGIWWGSTIDWMARSALFALLYLRGAGGPTAVRALRPQPVARASQP